MCVPSVCHVGWGGSRWLVGFIPTWATCSRHNTSRLNGPNVLLVKVVSVGEPFGSWYHAWEHFTRDRTWPGQLFRPSVRSHQQALGNLTNAWKPVGSEPSISVVKLFHSTTWIMDSRSRVCTIGLSWMMGRFSMVGGIHTQNDGRNSCPGEGWFRVKFSHT